MSHKFSLPYPFKKKRKSCLSDDWMLYFLYIYGPIRIFFYPIWPLWCFGWVDFFLIHLYSSREKKNDEIYKCNLDHFQFSSKERKRGGCSQVDQGSGL